MNRLLNILIILLLMVGGSSCKKAFEDYPLQNITEDVIWDVNDVTGTNASRFLSKAYTLLPDGYARLNGVPLECVSDDAVPSNTGNASWNVINGGYSPLSTFDDDWANCYKGIRVVNTFLANYQKVPWADTTLKKWLPNEGRVLRAFFYYEMLRRYGGVPIIGDKIYEATDPALLTFKRNSFDSCVNYIVSQLNIAQDSLRPDETLANRGSGNGAGNGTDVNAGRMRKSIVLAIKAKVLLLAASPLFNPSPTPAKDYTGYASYSADRWKAAADAALAVINLNLFQLEANPYMMTYSKVNKEFIFTKMGGGTNSGTNNYPYSMSPVGYTVNLTKCSGLVSPTQELVDAFPMKNGLPITATGSGYNAANPYTGRDPRLTLTVFYNGGTWLKRAVQTYEGGLDKPNNIATASVQTLTGYYAKKFCPNDSSATSFTASGGFWPIIRYADILLMYAEAKNEYSGVDLSVLNAVDSVRKRAGLSPYSVVTAYGGTPSQAGMRSIIRNERRCELAFEEQRFWDIRRWMIASSVYGTTLHGVSITNTSPLTYTKMNVAAPYFNASAMYLFPISYGEVLANPNLLQNPGY